LIVNSEPGREDIVNSPDLSETLVGKRIVDIQVGDSVYSPATPHCQANTPWLELDSQETQTVAGSFSVEPGDEVTENGGTYSQFRNGQQIASFVVEDGYVTTVSNYSGAPGSEPVTTDTDTFTHVGTAPTITVPPSDQVTKLPADGACPSRG
jgi:hypothetical protein